MLKKSRQAIVRAIRWFFNRPKPKNGFRTLEDMVAIQLTVMRQERMAISQRARTVVERRERIHQALEELEKAL